MTHAFRVPIWANEVHQNRAFKALRSTLLAVSKRISGGKVTY